MKVTGTSNQTATFGHTSEITGSIAVSAHAYEVVSKSLYSHTLLAFIRETLTNAVDAHTEAGKPDAVIKIIVDKRSYKIVDEGRGISKEDFGPIYMTLFQGTKENDDSAIGGFGLGCKSPHAYCDSFEVVSKHNGIATVYQVAKEQGLPKALEMGSMPTDSTGLSVTVPIQEKDHWKILDTIRALVYLGDMNVELNGDLLPRMNMPEGADSFAVLYANQDIRSLPNLSGTVFVRYGRIIYPASVNSTEYRNLLQTLKGNGYTSHSIIMQAEPNTLHITPSREALLVDEVTTNTLNQLMSKIDAKLSAAANPEALTALKSDLLEFQAKYYNDQLVVVPGTKLQVPDHWELEENYTEMLTARQWAEHLLLMPEVTLSDIDVINKRHTPETDRCSVKNAHVRHIVSSFFKNMPASALLSAHTIRGDRLETQLYGDLIKKLEEADTKFTTRMFIGSEPYHRYVRNILDLSGFTEPKVILSSQAHPPIKDSDALTLIVNFQRSKSREAALEQVLIDSGIPYTKWVPEPAAPTPRPKKVKDKTSINYFTSEKGILALSNLRTCDTYMSTKEVVDLFDRNSSTFLKNPKYVMYMPRKDNYFEFYSSVEKKLFDALHRRMSDEIGICFNARTFNKHHDESSTFLEGYLEKLEKEWKLRKKEYIKSIRNKVRFCPRASAFIAFMQKQPETVALLPFKVESDPVSLEMQQLIKDVDTLVELSQSWIRIFTEVTNSLVCIGNFADLRTRIDALAKDIAAAQTHTDSYVKFEKQTIQYLLNVVPCFMDFKDDTEYKPDSLPFLKLMVREIKKVQLPEGSQDNDRESNSSN